MKVISGAKKIAFFNPSAPADTVVVDGIGVATAGPGDEIIATETTTGAIHGGFNDDYTLIFHKPPAGGIEKLREWTDNDTPVQAIVLLSNGAIGIYEATELQNLTEPAMNARDGLTSYRVQLVAIAPRADIYESVNLFKVFAYQPVGDAANTGGVYIPKRATASDFGLQDYGTGTGQVAGLPSALVIRAPFPFQGVPLLFSATIDDGGDAGLTIRALDASGSSIATDSDTGVSDARADCSIVTPAGTVFVELTIEAESGDPEISGIQIRMDGKLNFIP